MTTVSIALNLFFNRRGELSPRTLEWYKTGLQFLEIQYGNREIEAMQPAELRRYLEELIDRSPYRDAPQRPEREGTLAGATVIGRYRALKTFFNWAMREYGIEVRMNPMRNVRPPRVQDEPDPKAAEISDLRLLLAACEPGIFGLRDRAILYLLAGTGIRSGGLAGLKWEHIDFDNLVMVIRKKGGKRQRINFDAQLTAPALLAWRDAYPNGWRPELPVFCGLHSRYYRMPLNTEGVYRMLERLKERAKLPRRCNPNAWRHCFGQMLADAGCDIATVQRLMGHSSPLVTARYYLDWNEDQLREKFLRFNPLKKIHRP